MIRKAALPAVLAVILPLLVFGGTSGTTTAASAVTTGTLGATAAPMDVPALNRLALASLPRWAPGRTTPQNGPSFNNPNGSLKDRRRNLDRIYRYVQSTKGYRVKNPSQCPRGRRNWPNRIRIALYSFSDPKVADALIRAHRRCISVRVLMNDHLTNGDVPAFGRLQKALGWKKKGRSWAARCKQGCRGRVGPLHTKMWLFTRVQKARHVTVTGSSNLTGKAANVQWNDLIAFKERPGLFKQFRKIFNEMARDRVAPKPLERNYKAGPIESMWWPQPGHTRKTDRVLKTLKKVNCKLRPRHGTGYAGRTGVAINIHAMEGERGFYIAKYIVRMHKAGCRIRMLYGLIAPRINRVLKEGGVPIRRTIFDRDENDLTDMYTHMKVLAVNGVFGDDRSTRFIYTGSENFSHRTVGADEVWVKVPFTPAWRKYQKLFDMIWNSDYYSNPRYAFYHQSDTPIHARKAPPRPGSIGVTQEDLEG